MLQKNNICYVCVDIIWYFPDFLKQEFFPAGIFNPEIYYELHLRTFCWMFLILPSPCGFYLPVHSFRWNPFLLLEAIVFINFMVFKDQQIAISEYLVY